MDAVLAEAVRNGLVNASGPTLGWDASDAGPGSSAA